MCVASEAASVGYHKRLDSTQLNCDRSDRNGSGSEGGAAGVRGKCGVNATRLR